MDSYTVPGQFVSVRHEGGAAAQRLYALANSPYAARRESANLDASIIEVCTLAFTPRPSAEYLHTSATELLTVPSKFVCVGAMAAHWGSACMRVRSQPTRYLHHQGVGVLSVNATSCVTQWRSRMCMKTLLVLAPS